MEEGTKRLQKVTKFQIIKPVNMTWEELGKMLRDVRYRLWRLANMAVCENYMRFYKWETGEEEANEIYKVKTINRNLRRMLIDEKKADEKDLLRYSRNGAVSGYINGAFEKMKLRAITSKSKWREVLRGKSALPLFRRDLAIPINCSDHKPSIIEKMESGEFEVDLRICQKPYPRVLLSTEKISDGERSILERLVSNKTNSPQGWRHRFFEIKEKPKGKWFIHVIYNFPKAEAPGLHSDIVVGVDLGWSVPLYAAINNGYARIGYKKMKPLGDRIKHLQKQIKGRRLSIQKSGAQDLSASTSRSGHGRNRILKPIEKLENKIDNAYTTLNHQLSHCVIDFAKNHGAGRIQIEDLRGLKNELSGTFIGQNWRYKQLQDYIKYKADEEGIKVEEINPCYTSRRCSECGYINKEFDREYRDKNSKNGKSAMFECPKCSKNKKKYKPLNADYNAARNISIIGIEEKIRLQCQKQGIEYRELPKD